MAPSAKPPVWFWIVGVLMLLWNGVGVMAYIGEAMMPADALQALPEAQRTLILGRPAWRRRPMPWRCSAVSPAACCC